MDFIEGAVRIDDAYDIAIIAAGSQIAFANTFKEFSFFAFEAVKRPTAICHALAACLDCQVQNNREFWEAATAGEFREPLYFVCTEPASVPLIRKRAPCKTVGDNNVPCIKRRLDDFVNHLGAGRIVQQKFGIVSHDALERRVQEQFANTLRNFCASGFTQPNDLVTFRFKCVNQQVNLR